MKRSLVLALAAAAILFTATAANANRVDWSIGINVPSVATYVSGGPAYYQAPEYYRTPGYYRDQEYYRNCRTPEYYAPPVYPGHYPSRVDSAPRSRIWLPPAPPLPRPPWFHGHDRWHDDGDRDGYRDAGRERGHNDRVDWRR